MQNLTKRDLVMHISNKLGIVQQTVLKILQEMLDHLAPIKPPSRGRRPATTVTTRPETRGNRPFGAFVYGGPGAIPANEPDAELKSRFLGFNALGSFIDPAGLGEFVDALGLIGLTPENKGVLGAPQGYAMMNAIKTAERKLANGTLKHSGSSLAAWCASNVKIEPTATAIRATKQNTGDLKIDVIMALFDAVTVMALNPGKAPSFELTFV